MSDGAPNSIEIEPDIPQQIAAAVAFAVSLALLIKYAAEISDDIDRLKEYYDKMIEVAEYYNDQYINIIEPELVAAIQAALDAPVFGVDYNINNQWHTRLNRAGLAAERSEDIMLRTYRLRQQSPCDNHLVNDFKASAGDGAFMETQAGERREERMRATKWRSIQSLLPSATKGAQEIMNFIGNAIDLRSSSLAMAAGGFNGSLGTLSWSLNALSAGHTSRSNNTQNVPSDPIGYNIDYGTVGSV